MMVDLLSLLFVLVFSAAATLYLLYPIFVLWVAGLERLKASQSPCKDDGAEE